MVQATDLRVRTASPELLDQTVQSLGPAVVVEGSFDGDAATVRVFGDPGFIKFAITRQGYGEIIGEEVVT